MDNLKIIGTSHIAKQSLKEVKEAIEEFKPDIIAIELDRRRLIALTQKKNKKGKKNKGPSISDIRRIGIKGFIFSLIGGWASQKLGKLVGVSPGSEMLAAVKIAKQKKLIIALIDQDIEITLRRFSDELTWKEKWNFVVDIFNAVILRKKEDFGFDLSTVPSDKIITKLIGRVKDRYPSIYKVLIEERNVVMAKNINSLMKAHPEKKIVAILGAGHKEEMLELIKDMNNHINYSFSFDAQ